MNYAHIKDGKIHNVVVGEPEALAAMDGQVFVPLEDGFWIGDFWNGSAFIKNVPVAEPVPKPAKIAQEKEAHKKQVLDAVLSFEGPALDNELKRLKKSFADKKKQIEES